jgi:hypothetical protein
VLTQGRASSLQSPGVLLKGLLLKAAVLAKKKSEKFSKIQKYIKKQLTKTIHAFQNEFQKIKTQETLGKTEQIPEKKHTKINILKKEK